MFKDHIADIARLDVGVQVPDDAGFLFIFSIGWRKGLFYDFGPLGPNRMSRLYDIGPILGQAYCHVLFQERFSISDSEWDRLLKAKWFLFIGLTDQTIKNLVSHAQAGWDPDEKLDDIVSEVKNRSTQMLNSWREHPSLVEHIGILERAVEHFQNDDPMSCTGLLFPRIEGILRTHHNRLGATNLPSSQNLSESAIAAAMNKEICLLFAAPFSHLSSRRLFFELRSICTENRGFSTQRGTRRCQRIRVQQKISCYQHTYRSPAVLLLKTGKSDNAETDSTNTK